MALATQPGLLMLDEPAAGLHDEETRLLAKVLSELPNIGVSVLLIDHNMRFLLGLCQRLVVLESGEKLAEGTPDEIVKDNRVIEIYLGSRFRGQDEAAAASALGGLSASSPDQSVSRPRPMPAQAEVRLAPLPSQNAEPHAEAGQRLAVRGLHAGYGPVKVLKDVSLTVADGEVMAVLGPNGAGKTTLLRAISGAVRLFSGVIEYDGTSIAGLPANEIVRHGIAHVLQGRRIFSSLSVEENQSSALAPSVFTGAATVPIALMVVLGGGRTLLGPVDGAIVLTFMPYWFSFGPRGTQYAQGIALVLILLLLPEGIVPGLVLLPRRAAER